VSLGEAARELDMNRAALTRYFRARGIDPTSLLAVEKPYAPQGVPEPSRPGVVGTFSRLVDVLKKGPIGFNELCDKLDLSPRRARELVEAAQEEGLQVHLENEHAGLRNQQQDDRVQPISSVPPTVGEVQRVAVISDTHAGSKFVLKDQLREFVQYAYDQGIRTVLHPGDVLDGCYRHGVFEVTHTGADEQCQDAVETLPHLPGLRYHFITGNHDFTFQERSGFSIGQHIVSYFRNAGRNDITHYGDRSAFLEVGGAVVHLWHPKQGTSYARSYVIQKKIEGYSSIKPQILLIGHWHVFAHVYERGVRGIACPTFQGGGSAFGKSLTSPAPAIGGLILEWRLTEHGTIREFTLRDRFYFEKEEPVKIYNALDAEPVAPTLYRASAVRR
jgi:predicted phosphodiesterase